MLKQRSPLRPYRFRVVCALVLLASMAWVPVLIKSSAATKLQTVDSHAVGYEIWLTDQNNTAGYSATAPRGTHGGRLLIYDSADLDHHGPVDNPTIIDMAEIFSVYDPHNTTGANVVRPT